MLRFNRSSSPSSPRPMWRKKRLWAALLGVSIYALLASCSGTRMLMQTAPSQPKGEPARPAITAATINEWETAKPDILKALEDNVYGQIPTDLSLQETASSTIDGKHFGGSAKLEIRHFKIQKDGAETGRTFSLVIVSPAQADKTIPVIMMQNFCPNHDVIPHPDIPAPDGEYFSCSGGGVMGSVFRYFFGRYITTPPIKDIMERGYGLAVMYPTEFVPDSRTNAPPVLNTLFADQDNNTRTAAIAAWAAQFTLIRDYLETNTVFSHHIAYGHSRFGKSALLAAAFDENINAVIAHQSGTGGASLSRDKPGETVKDITEGFPYWFSKSYADVAGQEETLPVDQHQLLALIAPRPIMLGNAKRDVWSDPNGAFRAAQGANPVYKLYGSNGLRQAKLTAFDPAADIAFWIRPGTHGVVKEDWPAFLEFLDSHFKE